MPESIEVKIGNKEMALQGSFSPQFTISPEAVKMLAILAVEKGYEVPIIKRFGMTESKYYAFVEGNIGRVPFIGRYSTTDLPTNIIRVTVSGGSLYAEPVLKEQISEDTFKNIQKHKIALAAVIALLRKREEIKHEIEIVKREEKMQPAISEAKAKHPLPAETATAAVNVTESGFAIMKRFVSDEISLDQARAEIDALQRHGLSPAVAFDMKVELRKLGDIKEKEKEKAGAYEEIAKVVSGEEEEKEKKKKKIYEEIIQALRK